MSESFLSELADQLRNQTPPADPAPVDPAPVDPTPAEPAPVDPTPEPIPEPNPEPASVDKEWWDKEGPTPPVDSKSTNEPKETQADLDED